MRLLKRERGKFHLVEFRHQKPPPYAILSHVWGTDEEEVTFEELSESTGKMGSKYRKLVFCANQAAKNRLEYCWVDTCCIDKKSSQELQEAIGSMYRWYQDAEICYVYLKDVFNRDPGWHTAFKESKWFHRGWTLQELIAPRKIVFFSAAGQELGERTSLAEIINETTKIPIDVLKGSSLSSYGIHQRLAWEAQRQTKRGEDKTYCLLGLLGIRMRIDYSEGEAEARRRLLEKIKKSPGHENCVLCPSAGAKRHHDSRQASPSARSYAIEGSSSGNRAFNGYNHGIVTINNISEILPAKRRYLEESPTRNSKRARSSHNLKKDRGSWTYSKSGSCDSDDDDEDEDEDEDEGRISDGTSSEDSEKSKSDGEDSPEYGLEDSADEDPADSSEDGSEDGIEDGSDDSSGDSSTIDSM